MIDFKERKKQLEEKKKDLKLTKKELKVQEKVNAYGIRKYELENPITPPDFNGKEVIGDLIATTSANNFSEYEFSSNQDIVKKLDKDNLFEKWNRANVIASKNGVSAMVLLQFDHKEELELQVGSVELSSKIGLDFREITIDLSSEYAIGETEVIRYRYKDNKFGNIVQVAHLSSKYSENNNIVWQDTKFKKIPVVLVPNNSQYTNDLDKAGALIKHLVQTMEKQWDDRDFGGNKLIMSDLALNAFGNKDKEQALAEMSEKYRKTVISVGASMFGTQMNNSQQFEITTGTLFSEHLTRYQENILSLIYKLCGISESKNKNSAQETDTQLATLNEVQENFINVKRKLRVRSLQELVVLFNWVDQDSELPTMEVDSVKVEIKLPSEIKQEKAMEQAQAQASLKLGENNNEKSKDKKSTKKVS